VTIDAIKHSLALCGYSESLVCADFQFGGNQKVALAAFAHEPMDARSACVATIQTTAGEVKPQVVACRQLGAPLVIALTPTTVELWMQRQNGAELIEPIVPGKVGEFFRSHANDYAPEAVFRAKTWGRLDRQFQLSFVDAGLMPLVEREIGQSLTLLIERVVHGLRQALWPKKSEVSVEDGHWLIKSAFWILAAKILRDKKVPGFITLDLLQVEDVFARVARHYDSSKTCSSGIEVGTGRSRAALEAAAEEISRFSHLGHVTTESLAHVYESALITKETRAALGTHSTPPYLVDYVVWKLASWIQDIPEEERHVFEPACGHAAFLVASMRLLKELLSPDKQVDRKQYLRGHLHGVEVDAFAIEIARLSLTLADIPNPNGWNLTCGDMFTNFTLGKEALKASILLGNPPFENFSEHDRSAYARKGAIVKRVNKTAEVLGQVLPQLRVGGVFGFVVPQGILQSKNARDVRNLICRDFEIKEICLFPDKVFSFSGAESAVILGRRVSSPSPERRVSYRRVREGDMDRFELDYAVSSRQSLPQTALCSGENGMCLPDLFELWEMLSRTGKLKDLAHVGKGFDFKGRNLPEGAETIGATGPGTKLGFTTFDTVEYLHDLPKSDRLNLAGNVIQSPRTGLQTGTPQVLLNYGRAGRGPWHLKALLDEDGHPVTSRFITARPVSPEIPLKYLWAILNNPLANAFVYCHTMKRDVLVGLMRKMPIPCASPNEMKAVAKLVSSYLLSVRGRSAQSPSVREKLLRIDAEVLRLYDLPPKLERQVLDLFAGEQRAGVPFHFTGYFPKDFEPWLHLHEYLSDAFQNSSAKSVLESHRTFEAPEVTEALRRATEDFQEDE
jgi:hypothetical protein